MSADGQVARVNSVTRTQAYFVRYALNLFSNFTYYLDDPVRGDQFEQADRRTVAGARVTHRMIGRVMSRPMEASVGVQIRRDDIGLVGLYRTEARSRFATLREDRVAQTSAGLFGQIEYQWRPRLRTTMGLRTDTYRFALGSARQSGGEASPHYTRGVASPKLSVVMGPWNGTEVYANAGYGFHSNDARSVLSR